MGFLNSFQIFKIFQDFMARFQSIISGIFDSHDVKYPEILS